MLSRQFKLIFLPGGTSKKHEFNFSRRLFLLCVGAFALASLLISIAVGQLMYNWYSARYISSLQYKNSELISQLATADEQVEQLEQRVERLAQQGSDLRTYADLPDLDPETQQMGIGGSLPYQETVSTGAEVLLAKIEQLDRQISLQENSLSQVHEKIDRRAEYLRSVPSIRPANTGSFSSLYGRRRDPFTGQWEPHMGIDISARTGTPVYATADGRVIHVKREPGFGKTLVLDHGNGYKTLYAHLHSFLVTRGQRVKRGDVIAEIGNSGRSTGPHLHYEVIHNKQHQNPLDYMFEGFAMARLP